MKANLLLVINPTAGSINVNEVVAKTKEWSNKLKYNLEIYKTTGKNDQDRIEQLLRNTSFKRVVVAGGDGTINMVASKLLLTKTVLGILPCGSANGLATSLGIPKDVEKQIEIALKQPPFLVDTLFVNDILCVHIADVGLNAELIYNYETSNSSGMLGYAMHTIPTLFQSDYPYKFKISMDDKTLERKGVLLSFANTKKYGTGAIINPEGKINDGVFEIVLYKRLSFIEILKSFFKNRTRDKTTVEIHCAKSVSIESKEPIALQVDGEFIGEFDKFSAFIKPHSLQLAVQNQN